MYNNILVAIEPTHAEKHEQALIMAMQLATDNNSEITAITVVEPMPSHFTATEESHQKGVAAGKKAMAELRNFVGPLSEIKTVIQHGAAASSILDYAKEKHIDCIVIASHKPGLRDYFLGATAARVVRHAPCCVHVLR